MADLAKDDGLVFLTLHKYLYFAKVSLLTQIVLTMFQIQKKKMSFVNRLLNSTLCTIVDHINLCEAASFYYKETNLNK